MYVVTSAGKPKFVYHDKKRAELYMQHVEQGEVVPVVPDKHGTWGVTTRRDNGYPLIIYADIERAKKVAESNNDNFVVVISKKYEVDIKKFIGIIEKDVKESGGKVLLPMQRSVKLAGELIECNGYWDHDSMTFAAAMDQPWDDFLRLIVHEYGHFRQWKEKREVYTIIYNHPMKEELGEKSLEDAFFKWLEGSKELDEEAIKFTCDIARNLELDCEQVTIELIKKYDLPIDIEDYCRRASAYVYFYNILPETRQWYIIGKEPYNIPEIVELMPADLDGDYTTTSEEVAELMKKECQSSK